MGRDKAWLPWRGQPLIAHVVEVLARAVDDIVVVAAPDQDLPDLHARVVRDPQTGQGPLVGIAAGLAACSADYAFVTATDAPYLNPEFIRTLLRFEKPAAPELDGFVQTLSAVYPTEAHAVAQTLLNEGRRRPLDLLEAVDYRKVVAAELPDTLSVRGFNTPSAYLDAAHADAPGEGAWLEFTGRARVAVGSRELAIPVGTLADGLGLVRGQVELVNDDRVAPEFAVSLGGRAFVRDARVPVGPGERVVVLDAAAGG
jgi:molybdopterin-guanine dinucleotide biosynthesis protein A